MDKKITIRSENDIRIAVNVVRSMAESVHFSNVDKQKLIVAVSELTRNTLDHANGTGVLSCEFVFDKGLKITVEDIGPGIASLEKILNGDADFKKKGLGMGFLGAKRLMDDFTIETSRRGTKIIAVKWKTF